MIKMQNIVKTYPMKHNWLKVLDSLNLEINTGEFVGIMGTSGCGKTTLLNILGCIDEASSGTYEFNGKLVASLSRKDKAHLRNKNIGFVLQDFALIHQYTIADNIGMPMIYGHIHKSERKKRTLELAEKLGLQDKLNCYPDVLSGGEKQRVAFARALTMEPEVLLMDEPTGALDSKNTEHIMGLIKTIHDQGKTVILVTHDKEITSYCDRVIEMKDGRF